MHSNVWNASADEALWVGQVSIVAPCQGQELEVGLLGQMSPDFSDTLEKFDIKFSAEEEQLCRAVGLVKSGLLFWHVDLVKWLVDTARNTEALLPFHLNGIV